MGDSRKFSFGRLCFGFCRSGARSLNPYLTCVRLRRAGSAASILYIQFQEFGQVRDDLRVVCLHIRRLAKIVAEIKELNGRPIRDIRGAGSRRAPTAPAPRIGPTSTGDASRLDASRRAPLGRNRSRCARSA